MREVRNGKEGPKRPTIESTAVRAWTRAGERLLDASPGFLDAQADFAQTSQDVFTIGRLVARTGLPPTVSIDTARNVISNGLLAARHRFLHTPPERQDQAREDLRGATEDFLTRRRALLRITGEPLPEIPDTYEADSAFVGELQHLWDGDQRRLAEKTGVGESDISRVKSETRRWSAGTLDKVIHSLSLEEGPMAEDLLVRADLMREAAAWRAREHARQAAVRKHGRQT